MARAARSMYLILFLKWPNHHNHQHKQTHTNKPPGFSPNTHTTQYPAGTCFCDLAQRGSVRRFVRRKVRVPQAPFDPVLRQAALGPPGLPCSPISPQVRSHIHHISPSLLVPHDALVLKQAAAPLYLNNTASLRRVFFRNCVACVVCLCVRVLWPVSCAFLLSSASTCGFYIASSFLVLMLFAESLPNL